MTCRRRTRRKSSCASAEGKPVSRGGDKARPRYLARRRPHHATMDNPTPTGGGSRAPQWSNLCRNCHPVCPALYARAPQGPGARAARRTQVESGSMAAPPPPGSEPGGLGPGEKGLKSDAIGYASNVVIGVASTAPGYSLAATLGFIVAVAGRRAARRRRSCIVVVHPDAAASRSAYNYMNRADPDCGTTFAWVTRAMGPHAGWLGGWAIIVADIIVMANLAQIAGIYSFLLFGWRAAADSSWAVTLVGVVWIAVMTWICVIGIELNAAHAAVAARRRDRHAGAVRGRRAGQGLPAPTPRPRSTSEPRLVQPVRHRSSFERARRRRAARRLHLLGLGQRRRGQRGVRGRRRRARAGPRSSARILLVLIYVVVSVAAQAYGGPKLLVDNADDVLSVARQRGLRLAAGQAADHRGAHARPPPRRRRRSCRPRARACRWRAAGRCRSVRAASTRASRRPTSRRSAMGVVSIVWYVAINDRQPERPRRLDHRARLR